VLPATRKRVNLAVSRAIRRIPALSYRRRQPAVAGPTAEIRSRAYTLFMQAYNAVRRAVQYLEPERVDEIVPSIRVPRGPSKKPVEPEPVAPEAPEPDALLASARGPEGKGAEVPIGMPGASPFVRN
jgi:hypothetical protein